MNVEDITRRAMRGHRRLISLSKINGVLGGEARSKKRLEDDCQAQPTSHDQLLKVD